MRGMWMAGVLLVSCSLSSGCAEAPQPERKAEPGSKAEAEDLFQDVLVKAFARLDELVGIDHPGSWLSRVLYNQFVDNHRRYARQRLVMVSEGELPPQAIDNLPGDGTTQWIVLMRLRITRCAFLQPIDTVRGHRDRAHRITVTQTFPYSDNVRLKAVMLKPVPRAGASQAGGDFIDDNQTAPLLDFSCERLNERSRRQLDQTGRVAGLEDQRPDLLKRNFL